MVVTRGVRTGTARLPLHGGHAPRWLFKRMVSLSSVISEAVVDEFGTRVFLKRVASPFWFQSLSCVIGFDWHSSGTTTTTTAALKEAFRINNIGLHVAGGKGRAALKTLSEISASSLSQSRIDSLVRASRLSAKVDNSLVQDSFSLYHHAFFYDDSGSWSVVQQGLSKFNNYARRYHWFSSNVSSFVFEPHSGIISDFSRDSFRVLDLTSADNSLLRKASLDVINDSVLLRRSSQRSLLDFFKSSNSSFVSSASSRGDDLVLSANHLIPNMNKRQLDTLRLAADVHPSDFEELLSISGVGPALIRSLALTANIVYGSPVSWKDPAKFSFANGGKDGVPFPVDKRVMDTTTAVFRQAIEDSKISSNEKLRALKRLSSLADSFH